jgi:TolA-binding protein
MLGVLARNSRASYLAARSHARASLSRLFVRECHVAAVAGACGAAATAGAGGAGAQLATLQQTIATMQTKLTTTQQQIAQVRLRHERREASEERGVRDRPSVVLFSMTLLRVRVN